MSATGPSAVARPALSRTHVFERWLGRTEGAADVFARFLELMAARGRGDGKIASLAPGSADGRSAGTQAGEPQG